MKSNFDTGDCLEAASILAAISVPLLTLLTTVPKWSGNKPVLAVVAVSGLLFLFGALAAILELADIPKILDMKVRDAAGIFIDNKILILGGLVFLLIYQLIQTQAIF
ncbi:MAG: hypothetical protein ABSG90_04705 [Dehalococcoidia bacterium]|jgi:hypothetical protein